MALRLVSEWPYQGPVSLIRDPQSYADSLHGPYRSKIREIYRSCGWASRSPRARLGLTVRPLGSATVTSRLSRSISAVCQRVLPALYSFPQAPLLVSVPFCLSPLLCARSVVVTSASFVRFVRFLCMAPPKKSFGARALSGVQRVYCE